MDIEPLNLIGVHLLDSCLVKVFELLEHNQGANYITAGQFTLLFWNIFSSTMQDWLQEDQNLDPFDAANPMDHEDIADHMQRYWNIHFKRSKKNDDGRMEEPVRVLARMQRIRIMGAMLEHNQGANYITVN